MIPKRTSRKGASALVPALAISGMFAAVVATALLLVGRNGTSENVAANTGNVAEKPAASVDRDQQTPDGGKWVEVEGVGGTLSEFKTTIRCFPFTDADDLLGGHLAAGEFGPALQLADNTEDPAEKSAMLKQIADAQMKAGEHHAAIRTLRGIPIADERRSASREHTNRWASAAGGSGADFEPLKDLIQNETSGPWFDVDGVGGTMSEFETGVRVDPNGMLARLTQQELDGRLKALGLEARKADLNEDMARPSNLRLVSLTRLEREVQKRIAEGKPVVETMKNLAGLHKIEYLFVFPESGEVVIGGPAEGWQYGENGQPVSLTDGRPTLQLDDFVTVYRTFTEGSQFFNCLIVPRQEGLRKAREVGEASRKRGPLSGDAARRNFVKSLTDALGLQDVKVNGVPADSRVARVIVEADYRMKLIGVDKLDAGGNIPSYFDLMAKHPQKTQPALDALRWWLTMKYDAVAHSEDRNVFHIQGSSVLCQGLNEEITPDGKRIHTGKADLVNSLFAQNFTDHYSELARRDLVFADLQNVFDLSLVAALMAHERVHERASWTGGAFASGGGFQPDRYEPAKTVMSVSNSRVYRGKDVVIQVAGGVRGDLLSIVKNEKIRIPLARLGSFRDRAKPPQLPEGRWWWDVKQAR